MTMLEEAQEQYAIKMLRNIRTMRKQERPYAVIMLTLLNSLCFLIELSIQLLSHRFPTLWDTILPNGYWNSTLIQMGAITPVLFARGEEWRLFTYLFLHDGILHVVFNMYGLASAGMIERMFGHGRFLLIYFASGIMGGIGAWILALYAHLPLVVGASAAIFGIYAAYTMILLLHFRAATIPLYQLLLFFFLIFGGSIFLGNPLAHLTGLAIGLGMGYCFVFSLRKEAKREQEEAS